ncbi:MAG: tRNA lysidine(34) synthetase TilS [Rhodospirillaceae bacterium]|nr:tRNA lysidine(34) synthetase TilS [Rhodospirillaceae bacterium]
MTAEPVAARFAAAMAQFEPFEPRPLLAVAVSGGADSMALTLLANDWARRRRGRVVALTVDHGLRAESRAEAGSVGRWMRHHRIAHRILTWAGPKPATGLQAAARAARYRLLSEACRKLGALHLLLGHTQDDQAETVLLRLVAGSGPWGLAAMAAEQEFAGGRLLRPLLATTHASLEAFLRTRGQDWIEDPSNRDDRFARVRIRFALAGEAPDLRRRLANAAADLARFRAGEEAAVAAALARTTTIFAEGYARVDLAAMAALAPAIGRRVLAAVLATVGGLALPPAGDTTRRLFAALAEGRLGRGRTLGRCHLLPEPAGSCLVLRELRGVETLPILERSVFWDGRFALNVSVRPGPPLEVGPLGASGWAEIVAAEPALRGLALPYPVRLTLPALRDSAGLLAVPNLGYRRPERRKITAIAHFRPLQRLTPALFAAVGAP